MNMIKIAALILCCGIWSVDAMVRIVNFAKEVEHSFGWPRKIFTLTFSDGSQKFILHPEYLGTDKRPLLKLPITYQSGLTLEISVQELETLFNGGTRIITVSNGDSVQKVEVGIRCNEHNVCYLLDMEVDREFEALAKARQACRERDGKK